MKSFYPSVSSPSSKASPAKSKGATLIFALISTATLAACSQAPAPVIQGRQISSAPQSVTPQQAVPVEGIAISRVPLPGQTDIAATQYSRQSRATLPSPVVWDDTADIGVVETIAAPASVERPVRHRRADRRSKPGSFRISGYIDGDEPGSQHTATAPAPRDVAGRVAPVLDLSEPGKPVTIPRVKPAIMPEISRQIAVVIPRARPRRAAPEPVEIARAPETPIAAAPAPAVPTGTVQIPMTKAKPAESGRFVDIPIGPSSPTAASQVARATPSPDLSSPVTGIDQSKQMVFSWPVTGPVISRFGPTIDGKRNEGINIAVREGARVRAAETGTVAYVGNELAGYGNLLLVRHESGFVTAYAHNKDLLVKKGDIVQKGDVIALAGKSGSVEEPQLHFEVRKGVNALDPMKFLGRIGARG